MLVVWLQAAALAVGAVALLIETALGRASDVGRALADAGCAVFVTVVFVLLGRAVTALRPAARTPLVVLEVIALPVGYSLLTQSDRPVYGVAVLLSALVVLVLLFTPGARSQLDR